MLREHNTLGYLLKDSRCLMSFQSRASHEKDPILQKVSSLGGTHAFRISDAKTYEHDIHLSHRDIDAFGCLQLADYADLVPCSTGLRATWHRHYEHMACSQFSLSHAYSLKDSPYTFTQIYLQKITSALKSSTFAYIGIPVCLDDLKQLSPHNVFGNSFVIVPMRLTSCLELARKPKAEWRRHLTSKALTAYKMLSHQQKNAKSLRDTLIISAMGPLDRFLNNPVLNGYNFFMASTPHEPTSMNIGFWQSGGVQTFFYAYDERSHLAPLAKHFHTSWQEVIYA